MPIKFDLDGIIRDLCLYIGGLLVEDYPFFNDYSKIILIDYPYNRNVTGEVARVKNPDELRALLC